MKVLITCGAGYIGSHNLVEVISAGYQIFFVYRHGNAQAAGIALVGKLTNTNVQLAVGNIRNQPFLERVFTEFASDAVIHFAGLNGVCESVENPVSHYNVNVNGATVLLEVMQSHVCRRIVFSSSVMVYGEQRYPPNNENHPVAPIKPYGRTKLMVEQTLRDWSATHSEMSAVSIRYFNPVGAPLPGFTGENVYGGQTI